MDASIRPKALPGKRNLFRKVVLACFIAYLFFSILAGIVIANFSLKLHYLPLHHPEGIAAAGYIEATVVDCAATGVLSLT